MYPVLYIDDDDDGISDAAVEPLMSCPRNTYFFVKVMEIVDVRWNLIQLPAVNIAKTVIMTFIGVTVNNAFNKTDIDNLE